MSPQAVAVRQHRYQGADGLNLAADIGGDPAAPAVMLLHGGGQTRHSWGGAMRDLLAAGYHVISLDARGHGDSDWSPDGRYGLEGMAADLRAVIATLASKPALVGASMGGMTALYTVGNSSDALASALVMVDVVPRIDRSGAAKIQAFMQANPDGFATLEDAADAVSAYNPHRPRPKNLTGLMKNLRRRDNGRLYWHWDPAFLRGPDELEPPTFGDRLVAACDHIRIPTLLVRGLNSDLVTDAGVADFRQHLPQLEVFDVPGAGHMVAGDKNDAFNQGVFQFLQRHLPLPR
jgi:pimeloyl-ACP methyl ester carboxylesterase